MGWSGGRQGGGVKGSSRLAMEGVLQSDFSGDHAWNGPVAMDRVSRQAAAHSNRESVPLFLHPRHHRDVLQLQLQSGGREE